MSKNQNSFVRFLFDENKFHLFINEFCAKRFHTNRFKHSFWYLASHQDLATPYITTYQSLEESKPCF